MNKKANYKKFGTSDLYWRIVRTNADGSIKILLSDNDINFNGYSNDGKYAIGDSSLTLDNTLTHTPAGTSYMFGDISSLETLRGNTYSNSIATRINEWYSNNLTSYTNYLSNDAIYCNDRGLASGSTYSSTNPFNFKAYDRLSTNKTPTYDCTNSQDAFSGSNAEAKLKYPIALITADESAYASKWLSNCGWTMTPYGFIQGFSFMYAVNSDGYFESGYSVPISNSAGVVLPLSVRPATSLKSCVTWKSGDGSRNNPYEIEMNGGC